MCGDLLAKVGDGCGWSKLAEVTLEPTKRELDVLRALAGGSVENRAGLHPAGERTIGGMLAKGWIEEVQQEWPNIRTGYRITAVGRTVHDAGRAPRVRRGARLTTLKPRLEVLKSWGDR